jgi:hypothetical protein
VSEPSRLDEAAAQGDRGLLVLAGEIVLADGLANLLEHGEPLARRVQGLAPPPGEASRPRQGVDQMLFVHLDDRRKKGFLFRSSWILCDDGRLPLAGPCYSKLEPVHEVGLMTTGGVGLEPPLRIIKMDFRCRAHSEYQPCARAA